MALRSLAGKLRRSLVPLRAVLSRPAAVDMEKRLNPPEGGEAWERIIERESLELRRVERMTFLVSAAGIAALAFGISHFKKRVEELEEMQMALVKAKGLSRLFKEADEMLKNLEGKEKEAAKAFIIKEFEEMGVPAIIEELDNLLDLKYKK